jgi:hypothetical protein
MRRIVRLFAVLLLVVLIAIGWLFWNQPKRVDMAAFVPADSLFYLESNSLVDVARSLMNTDGWHSLAPYYGLKADRWQDRWLTYIARTTGIGSAQDVIAARAQVAFVMLDLNQNTSGDTLEFKSHHALVVETHTSQARMKPVIERLVGDLGKRTYGQPTFELIEKDNGEFLTWTSPDGGRKLVVSFDGSVAIIGNDEQSVSSCLAAHRGQGPSLTQQRELEEMRVRMQASHALAFGYVPSAKASALLNQTIPGLVGRLPEAIQRLLAAASSSVVGTVGWSAHPFAGGIEDRYSMSLKPAVVARLRSAFASSAQQRPPSWGFLPADTYSVTDYNLNDPAGAWETLKTTLSTQVDFATAVGLGNLEERALEPYGIDEPDRFLRAIKADLLTARLDSFSERAVVVARVADERALKEFVLRRLGPHTTTGKLVKDGLIVSADEQLAAVFAGDYFLLGSPEDLRRCMTARARQVTFASSPEDLNRVSHFSGVGVKDEPAAVITYTPDIDRSRRFIKAISTLRGPGPLPRSSADGERAINALPNAETETRLVSEGFERQTRSPFGLFATLVSFLANK